VISLSPSLVLIASTLLAYLIGGLPFGYWFIRLTQGRDIRTMGSGNIGATNVQRTAGTKAGIAVLFLDILKGFLAVWLAAQLTHDNSSAVAFAACAVMLGHCYPVFLGFKGGKAVACFIGAFAFITPLALVATTIVFILVVAVSRYISLGSIIGALVFPFTVWFFEHASGEIVAASIYASLLVLFRHKSNIARLRAGKENVFSFKSRKR
jgi:acyl phosphate:glycerol-3-phosphate acyltransferase